MIGLITLNSDTFTNPTLYSILKNLNERNIEVTIFYGFQESTIPEELSLTKYHNLPFGLSLPRRPDNIIKYVVSFYNAISTIKKNKIEHIFAIDPLGLVMAGRIKRFVNTINIHYFSFEIFFFDELKNKRKMLAIKKREVYYSKKIASIIIQDEERMLLLLKENKIDPSFTNWHLIPVSPVIDKKISHKKYQKSDFGLKATDTVYVHSGTISSWTGADLIIKALEKGLPENTFILIHSRYKFDLNDDIHLKLIKLKEKCANLILHDERFDSYNDLNAFLSCFDYGINLYVPDGGIFTGMNIKEIGLASGKFSTYMLAGLPTLLSECKTYKNILNNYAIGELVDEEKDLSYHIYNKSLTKINSSNCQHFYKNVLDPSKPVDVFINSIIN